MTLSKKKKCISYDKILRGGFRFKKVFKLCLEMMSPFKLMSKFMM